MKKIVLVGEDFSGLVVVGCTKGAEAIWRRLKIGFGGATTMIKSFRCFKLSKISSGSSHSCGI